MKVLKGLLIACVMWSLLVIASSAAATVQLDQQGCLEYAVWSRDLIWAREIGADREKVRVSLVEMNDQGGGPVFVLLLRDLAGLWATRADRKTVMEVVLKDCFARRGKYGDGT